MQVNVRNTSKTNVTITGWKELLDKFQAIAGHLKFARESGKFNVLYRCQSVRTKYLPHIFLVGQKSRATLFAGNAEKLNFDPKNTALNRELFYKANGHRYQGFKICFPEKEGQGDV